MAQADIRELRDLPLADLITAPLNAVTSGGRLLFYVLAPVASLPICRPSQRSSKFARVTA